MSLYWMLRLGFFSVLACFRASSARCCTNISYWHLVEARMLGKNVKLPEEPYRGQRDHKRCIVGANVDVLILSDDLLYPRHWSMMI